MTEKKKPEAPRGPFAPRRTLADVFRSKPGRDLAGAFVGGLASGLVDLVDGGKLAVARTNVLRVRCTCGASAEAPAPAPPSTAAAVLTVGQLGAFAALHGEHGGITATARKEDGTTDEHELSAELSSFAGGATRGFLSGSLARAAHEAAQLFLKRGKPGGTK